MPFTNEAIEQYLATLPEHQRQGARDLLNNPLNMTKLLTAHHNANDEAKNARLFIDSTFGKGSLTNEQMQEVGAKCAYINEFPDLQEERFLEVMDEFDIPHLISTGELSESDVADIGLILDEETGKIDIDRDDGEIYADENDVLVDGNGFMVDENGNFTDEPVYDGDALGNELRQREADLQDEYDERVYDLEQREHELTTRQQLIEAGVSPEHVSKLASFYTPPEPNENGEITPEMQAEHINSYRNQHPSFFGQSNASNGAIFQDTTRVSANNSNSLQYEQIKQNALNGDSNALKDMITNAPSD